MTADGQGKNCPDEKAIAQHAENPGDFLHLASPDGIKIMPMKSALYSKLQLFVIIKCTCYYNLFVHLIQRNTTKSMICGMNSAQKPSSNWCYSERQKPY